MPVHINNRYKFQTAKSKSVIIKVTPIRSKNLQRNRLILIPIMKMEKNQKIGIHLH